MIARNLAAPATRFISVAWVFGLRHQGTSLNLRSLRRSDYHHPRSSAFIGDYQSLLRSPASALTVRISPKNSR
jgi:hypothetical protein